MREGGGTQTVCAGKTQQELPTVHLLQFYTLEKLQEITHLMKNKKKRGFTLIELMIVLVLVSILAAVTVPKLIQVSDRNKLGEVTNLFQQTVAEARSLAMKTRQAVVVEVQNNQMWINLLDGAACNAPIRKRCFHSLGAVRDAANINFIDLNTQEFQSAGVDMCDLRVATPNAANNGQCTVSADLSAGGVGLCYNGSGQLWIRTVADANTVCTETNAPDANANWAKACVPWIAGGASAITAAGSTWFSGADVRFNRFDTGAGLCPAGAVTPPGGAEDVTRRVIVPAGGHPFIKLVQSGM